MDIRLLLMTYITPFGNVLCLLRLSGRSLSYLVSVFEPRAPKEKLADLDSRLNLVRTLPRSRSYARGRQDPLTVASEAITAPGHLAFPDLSLAFLLVNSAVDVLVMNMFLVSLCPP